ncbi:Zinc finger CCCH domain-containing protein 14 [Linum perenne]
MNKPPPAPKPKIVPPNQPVPNGSTPPAIKTRICSKYNTAEGCKYGDKCHFAHGEWDLGRPAIPPHNDHHSMTTGGLPVHILTHTEPTRPASILGFGDTATAKVSIDASLAGSIIGKGGVNSKQICGQTGAKLSIREHETDPNLRNIELEGTFEQIGLASTMLKELIASIVPGAGGKSSGVSGEKPHPGNCYKTKMCDNFVKGSCSFGQRCHFAHGAAEMRKTGV